MTPTHDSAAHKCGLLEEDFRTVIDGKQTGLFILTNRRGMEVALTNFGCALLSIMVSDRNGRFGNVILSYGSIGELLNAPEPFLSTIVGRYANRIAQGRFRLAGKEYALSVNNGPNALHGGPTGFHRRVWDVQKCTQSSITLTYFSPDQQEGYPGNLTARVRYSVLEDNTLEIDYQATTDRTTLVNLTSHGFFNLQGTSDPTPDILSHQVRIFASHYLPIDTVSIPTGEILSVRGTPFDFLEPHSVGERIFQKDEQLIRGTGYDHCFVLDRKEPGELSLGAILYDPLSGRRMEVRTTEPGLQVYTGNWLNGFRGAHGATFPRHSAICFEAQKFPDTPNRPYFPSALLNEGETYRQRTLYRFLIQD